MPTQTKDYYAILGVKKNASADDIRKAFRKLAGYFQPPLRGGNCRLPHLSTLQDV